MKPIFRILVFVLKGLVVISCFNQYHPELLHSDSKDYQFSQFERIEAGDAFVIIIEQSPVFKVRSEGERRNLDHVVIDKTGSTLSVKFDGSQQHAGTTYLKISMPVLVSVATSDACELTIKKFKGTSYLELNLSDASVIHAEVEALVTIINQTDASNCILSGTTDKLILNTSPASEISSGSLQINVANPM